MIMSFTVHESKMLCLEYHPRDIIYKMFILHGSKEIIDISIVLKDA
jgi:hypothetical protein